LVYKIVIWRATYPTYLKKLQVLQNKAIRIIIGANYYDNVDLAYMKLKILKIVDLVKYETAKFVYCCLHNKSPPSFKNYFFKVRHVSKTPTRLSTTENTLCIPRYRSNRLQRGIKYQGVKTWNSIPIEIKSRPYNSFKKRCKGFYLSYYN